MPSRRVPDRANRRRALAIGLVAGTVADAIFADPRRGHPVAAFGRAATQLERHLWRDDRRPGAAFWAMAVGGAVTVGIAIDRLPTPVYAPAVALATWTVLGGESLRREAATLADRLDAGDLNGARAQLPNLCGRDPLGLPADELCRAAVESVAENSSDAAVAPLFWGAVAGVPGLLGYRAVNTLDAMVGHRSPRYHQFGWAAARADDLANLIPARITAGLTALAAPLVGGRPADVAHTVARDGRRHPSPNSGMCESAFAAALRIRLGGRNVYGDRVEHRPQLGDGRPPGAADLRRSGRLARAVTASAAGLAAASVLVFGAARDRRRR